MNFALSLCFYGILFHLLFSLVNNPEEAPDTQFWDQTVSFGHTSAPG